MPRLSQSQRLGLLSVSLYAWVEGSTELRNAALLLWADIPSYVASWPEQLHNDDWRIQFLHWLTRSSRELDHGEKSVVAGLDLTTALVLLKILRVRPLLAFLMTPLLATVPVPSSFNAGTLSQVTWFRTALTIFLATFVEEANKVSVLQMLRIWRKRRKATGPKIVARGAPLRLPLELNEEDEVECLICSGLGTEDIDPMAQSISSLSSANFETSSINGTLRVGQDPQSADAFGPLEEFCTTAPHMHVAHRECFLRWVEAYRQQHQRVFMEPVTVQYQSPAEGERTMQRWQREERARIKIILHAAGFEHVLPGLIFPTPGGVASSPTNARRPPPSSTLTIALNSASRSASANPQTLDTLATLRTSSPSCPACRGPVSILLTRESPTRPKGSSKAARTLERRLTRVKKVLRSLAKGWLKECAASVTGRSLLIRLAAQYSFLLVLVSMIRASGRIKQKPA